MIDGDRIKDIIVLGGGTAGWMTAAYLGRALGSTVGITVVESPSIPKIGVGEATIPNLQKVFFDFLGLPEDVWMRECNASFKLGIRFVNWRTSGVGDATARLRKGRLDHFDHIFGLLPNVENIPLSHYWARDKLTGATDEPFDYACYRQPIAFDRKLSPRHLDGTSWTSYAWHFDAHLVADFLRRFATKEQGAGHIEDRFVHADMDERGHVTAIHTETGRRLAADLFVDCSGFRSLLVNGTLGEPFLDMSDHLLNDRAVATSVPHDDAAEGVEPFTSAIAMSSGWSWKIPLLGRFGTGYVYSSQFATEDEATEEFCRMWGLDPTEQSLNHIKFRVGRNRRAWVKNVVGIGLSSCFLEPLESTGIYFIYASLYHLVKHIPDRRFDPVLIERFNREIESMFDDTRDFIQAHFSFAPRDDTPFWRACKDLRLADEFAEKVAAYRSGLPVNMPVTNEANYYGNFEAEFRNFWSNANYYCVLAGIDYLPEHTLPLLEFRTDAIEQARAMFADIKRQQAELTAVAPSTYDYLCQLHGKR
ncbi:tryptophan halogenase family protein [Amycolatopsis speibonae]|uniref:Tryptophan halogenase family protein n=1 Tax=Amycolatopsis speibonae TaxID=1450224 RepID=A0ABV7P272_9PSEU